MRDPLSDMLTLLDVQAVYAGGLQIGGPWCIRFPPPAEIKFFVIGEGRCFLSMEGLAAPLELAQGDVLLLKAQRPFVLSGALGLPEVAAEALFGDRTSNMVTLGGGGDFVMLGGHLHMASPTGSALMEALPDHVHLPAAAVGAQQLQWIIRAFVHEATQARPGGALACGSLAQLMFLHVLRGHLSQHPEMEIGWLKAACDPLLAPVLQAMHEAPAHPWQLAELARRAGMSRTKFAIYFKSIAGTSPLAYLTQWRMRLAQRHLQAEGVTVGEVAEAVGYTSEAAFSTAFKRVMGVSPKRASRLAAGRAP